MIKSASVIAMLYRIAGVVKDILARIDIRKRDRRIKRTYKDINREARRGDTDSINDRLRGRK